MNNSTSPIHSISLTYVMLTKERIFKLKSFIKLVLTAIISTQNDVLIQL